MTHSLLLAIALMLLLEGIGPMLLPGRWQRLMAQLASLPPSMIQRYGGILVVAGTVMLLFVAR